MGRVPGLTEQPCNEVLTGGNDALKLSGVPSRRKPPDLQASQLIIVRQEHAGAADGVVGDPRLMDRLGRTPSNLSFPETISHRTLHVEMTVCCAHNLLGISSRSDMGLLISA